MTAQLQAGSLPAFAAAMRRAQIHRAAVAQTRLLRPDRLVPMYRISGASRDQEKREAVQAIDLILDRLRRLAQAYGEWQSFDAAAYFDLQRSQADALVRVSERVNTVHITFFTDLLLPSFRQTVQFWASRFLPAYRMTRHLLAHGQGELRKPGRTFQEIQAGMMSHWAELLDLVNAVRAELWDDLGFLAASAAAGERERWRRQWQPAPAPGVHERLLSELSLVPTLTLAVEFPLPANRQPGRLRRLRRNRAHRRRFQLWGYPHDAIRR